MAFLSLVECPSSHFMSNEEVFCFVAMTLNDGRFFIFHSFITGVCSWIFHCSYADDVAVVVVAADAVIVEDVAVVLLLFLVDIDNDYREPKFGSTDI